MLNKFKAVFNEEAAFDADLNHHHFSGDETDGETIADREAHKQIASLHKKTAKNQMAEAMRRWIELKYKAAKEEEKLKRKEAKEKAKEYEYAWLIIDENNFFKKIWDFYVMACVLYVAVVVPFRLGFNLDDTQDVKIVGYVIDFSFLIDMALTFLTEVYDEGTYKTINTHRELALLYIKGWFLFDALSIFPFEMCLPDDTESNVASFNQALRISRATKIYKILRFLRLARLAKVFKQNTRENIQNTLKIQAGVMRMLFFSLILVIAIHIYACAWVGFAFINDRSWMSIKIEGLAGSGEDISATNGHKSD